MYDGFTGWQCATACIVLGLGVLVYIGYSTCLVIDHNGVVYSRLGHRCEQVAENNGQVGKVMLCLLTKLLSL